MDLISLSLVDYCWSDEYSRQKRYIKKAMMIYKKGKFSQIRSDEKLFSVA